MHKCYCKLNSKLYRIITNDIDVISCKLKLALLFITMFVGTTKGQLRINEIMHSNIDCFYNHGILPESWIELYNPTDQVVYIYDYRLGTTPSYDDAYPLYQIWGVFPLCYETVACDKNLGNVLMKLDSDGGKLYLFDENKNIIDSLAYNKMTKPNVSWGREPNGDNWGTMLRPTPGKANTKIANDEFPSKVNFSVDGGIWEQIDPFYVELSADGVQNYYSEQIDIDSSLCIKYTLDGTEPTDSSSIYIKPLYINTTTFIRAKVFDATKPLLPSNSVSYINHGRPVDKNVVSIITDSLYFYGKEEGIMGNRDYASWGVRRPMNFEYFPLDNEQKSINTLCKGRAGGNVSRVGDPYINIVLYAKKEYGDKNFKTIFWPHQKPSIKENKSIYLRCGDKQKSYLRDAVNMNIASLLDIDYLATDALSVYLNGNFYGLLYIYERSDEDYIWANYNKLKDVDLISIEGFQNGIVKAGTIDEFNKFKDFWQSAPHSLNEWRKWMDIDEYTDVMALELFSANKDFWYNNIRLYKSRLDSSAVWRWIANDFDYTFTDFFDNSYFKWALEDDVIHKSEDYGSQLWRGLLNGEEYKEYFLNKIIAYHGDFLNKTTYCACVDSLHKLTDFETLLTVQMYYGGKTGESDHNNLKECITKRSDYFHTDLQTFFKLGQAVNVKVNNLDDEKLELYYNDIKLKTGSFDGWDFVDRTLSIQTKNNDVIEPMNWIVEKVKDNLTEYEMYSNIDKLTYIIPANVDKIVFTPIRDQNFSFPNNFIKHLCKEYPIMVYDFNGRLLYNSNKNETMNIPKNVPLLISVNGQIKKYVFR